jgi:hypothetical protein
VRKLKILNWLEASVSRIYGFDAETNANESNLHKLISFIYLSSLLTKLYLY